MWKDNGFVATGYDTTVQSVWYIFMQYNILVLRIIIKKNFKKSWKIQIRHKRSYKLSIIETTYRENDK